MLSFLLDPGNVPFAVALALMGGIALLEVVTLAFGMAASGLVDSILPDFDFDLDVDLDVDADMDAPDLAAHTPALSALFSWLHIGRVPTLILLAAFLFGFGLSGLVVQAAFRAVLGLALTPWLAWIPAFFGSLPVMHVSGRVFRNVLPAEETDAVARKSLIGKTAVVTLGTARAGEPAQARLKDGKGQTHYVMVEPRGDSEVQAGEEVVLVGQHGATFSVVPSSMPPMNE